MLKKIILPIYLNAHRLLMKLCWNLFVHFPLDRHKIVFSNFNGGGYGDNPKFIAQEFLRRKLGWKPGDFPMAEKHFERIISLPLYPSMTDEQVQYVIDAVRDIVEKFHK